MPPRVQPQTYILLLKTHKLTVFIPVPNTTTIDSLKDEALTALQSGVLDVINPHIELNPNRMDVDDDPEWVVPKVRGVKDFELSKSIKERGRPTGRYQLLDGKAAVKDVLVNWEMVFVQFRAENDRLLPVKVKLAPLLEEADEEEISAARKGKRKAPPEEPA